MKYKMKLQCSCNQILCFTEPCLCRGEQKGNGSRRLASFQLRRELDPIVGTPVNSSTPGIQDLFKTINYLLDCSIIELFTEFKPSGLPLS